MLFLFLPLFSSAEEKDLAERIEVLEKEILELNKRIKESDNKEANSSISSFRIDGEYRNRALIEVNTVNNYMNADGTILRAYNSGATTSNDYGWWDHRLQLNTETTFHSEARLVVDMEIEDAVWGNQSRIFEGREGGSVDKFDDSEIEFKQLYMDIGLFPLSLRGRIGRQDMQVGSGLLFGNRHDGFRFYSPGDRWEVGVMHTRQWEGENAEMTASLNDDEDTYIVYAKGRDEMNTEIFALLNRMHVSKAPGDIYDYSPLYLLPGFTQQDYEGQEHYMAGVGAAFRKDFGKFTARLEGDYVWGTVYSSNSEKDDIEIGGFAVYAKLDYRQSETSRIAFFMGYGTGDDPDTSDYEGFFAPDNNFGIDEGYTERYKGKYMEMYEYLSPGAGVPGKLWEKPGPYTGADFANKGYYNYGTGGLENTTIAMLSWDYTGLPRHRFYFAGAYLRASEPNPDTDSAEIGVEIDGLVEYYFSQYANFSLYGGHLFITGDYFGKNAGDAANLVGEFRLRF